MSVFLEPRCKLCCLIREDKELWTEVHRRVLEKGLARLTVMGWLNGKILDLNKHREPEMQLAQFNQVNFKQHFDSHVKDKNEIEEALTEGFRILRHRGKYKVPHTEEETAALEEYDRTLLLIKAVERRLDIFDSTLRDKELLALQNPELKKTYLPNLEEIAMFERLVTNLVKLRKDAAIMQASNKIAGQAIHDALEMFVEVLVDRAVSIASEIRNLLSRELPGSNLPTQIFEFINVSLGENIKTVVPEVLDEIRRRYKIK